jgi:hypothetical protein
MCLTFAAPARASRWQTGPMEQLLERMKGLEEALQVGRAKMRRS